MRKILIVSPKNLLSLPFEGAQKRIGDVSKFLSKKNKIDLICIGKKPSKNKNDLRHFNDIKVFKINFYSRILNMIISLFKLEPLQNGYFFSKEMSEYINQNKDSYDVIIFNIIRSAQYLPNEFRGKAILDIADLASVNYEQTIKNLSFFNPLKYLYFLENILVKRYEKKILNDFDKVVLVSKKELDITKTLVEENKISIIGQGFNAQTKVFKYKKNNYKILFIGNVRFLPNKLACYNFAKETMPKLIERYENIEFNIVGKINFIDKFLLSLSKNVKVHGPVFNLKPIFTNSICGICNVKIATGFQNKILTYMSYGIPAVASKESFAKDLFKKNRDISVFSNNKELIKEILKLKENQKFSNKLSKNSYNIVKNKFKIRKIYEKYQSIVGK